MSKFTPLADRLWRKVEKTDSCWVWTGYRNKTGYGMIGKERTRGCSLTHRVSWELAHGPIPNGLFVCHKCDNPGCVRPDHLFLGSQKTNMADCSAKGRHPRNKTNYLPSGEKHHFYKKGMKITREMAFKIRRDDRPRSVISAEYGVDVSLISYIKTNKIWKE
jgi:hypothetical protein